MLIVCLLFSSIVAAGVKDVKAEQMIGENTDSDMSEEYDVKLTYDVTGTWDGHSNVEVKLTNILDEKIEDWEIKIPADFEIKNIWNAKVISEQDNEYVIHNADWNQDIDVKGSVSK
jgi:chitinase